MQALVASGFEEVRSVPVFPVGAGWDIDPVSGKYTMRGLVFQHSQLAPPQFSGGSYSLATFFNSKRTDRILGGSLSGSVSLEVLDITAGVSYQREKHTTSAMGAIALVIDNEFLPTLVDLTNPSAYTLTPEAQQIASIQDPALRTSQWIERFGRFISVGYTAHGHLGLRAEVTDFTSFQGSHWNVFADGEAGLFGNGSLTFDRFIQDTLREGTLSLSLEYEGDQALELRLPSNEDLQDATKRTQFINQLTSMATGRGRREGLLLAPVSMLPIGVDPDISWSQPVYQESALQAKLAMDGLADAGQYNFPTRLRAFLSSQTEPVSGVDFGTLLDTKRAALIEALQRTWSRMVEYLRKSSSHTSFYRDQLVQANMQLSAANTDLQSVLTALRDIHNQLPQPTVRVYCNLYSPSPTPTPNGAYGTLCWDIDNLPYFDDKTDQELADWLLECTDSNDARLSILENMLPQFGPPVLRTACDGHLDRVFVTSVERHTSGPSAGLCHVTFWMRMNVNASSPTIQLRLKHAFGGPPITKDVNLFNQPHDAWQ